MTKAHGWMFLRSIGVIAFIFFIVWLIGWIFQISYPFWIAALLVWLFYPLIRLLKDKAKFPGSLAVLATLLLGLSSIIGAITGVVFLIIFGFRRISAFIPDFIQTTAIEVQTFFNLRIFPIWQNITGAMDSLTPEQQTTLQQGIATLGSNLAETLTYIGQAITDNLTQLVLFVPTFLLAFLFVIIAFYFIGKDWDSLYHKWRRAMPAPFVKKTRAFRHMLRYRVFGFIRAQVALMLIASIIVLIGLLILRVENALTIAMIVGIAEILPYFGSGTILIPWFLYMLLTGNIYMGVGLAIVYGVTVLIRQSIEPKVLSSSMNLNALAVLISLFVGFQIFGVVGVFLGPMLLVILVIFNDIGVTKDITDFIKYGFNDPY